MNHTQQAADIAERLRWLATGSGTNHAILHDAADIIDSERALADDLADVLGTLDTLAATQPWRAEMERALARYREARAT